VRIARSKVIVVLILLLVLVVVVVLVGLLMLILRVCACRLKHTRTPRNIGKLGSGSDTDLEANMLELIHVELFMLSDQAKRAGNYNKQQTVCSILIASLSIVVLAEP
jgi:hypothetical protein